MKKRLLISSLFPLLMIFIFINSAIAADIPTRTSDVKRITIEELKSLQNKESVVVIDTRAPGQWLRAKDKVPGAMRLQSHNDLEDFKAKVPTDQAIATYCT